MIRKASVLLLTLLWEIQCNLEFPANVNDIVEIGKRQYVAFNEKVVKYGVCWKNAVRDLHDGCKQLTEDTQNEIALKFTDCFLRKSSHETCDCYQWKGTERKECMQRMSDRVFSVYTEFYTHTQNVCFYLKSQIWHEETEDTISRLSFASDKAANQLEELVDNSVNLKQALIDSHVNLKTMMAEFQLAATEQQRLLFDVFDRLSSLQEWAVGEISWLDTAIFYLCGLVVSHVLTGTPRTQSARFFLFLAFTINIMAERYICQLFVGGNNEKIDSININLTWWVWICRKILITVCCIILSIAVLRYQDYNIMNHTLLVKIQEQNQKLLGYLERVKMLEGSVSSSAPLETEIHVDSDSDYEVLNHTTKKYETVEPIITPSKLPQSPRATAAVLRKTEQVIQSALQSSINHFDIVHRSTRSSSPALSHISTTSAASTSSQRSRKNLHFDAKSPRTRYNLRHVKLVEEEEY